MPATKTEERESQSQCPLVIRVPTDLREAIKAKAAADQRSMASAIRWALTQYVRAAT